MEAQNQAGIFEIILKQLFPKKKCLSNVSFQLLIYHSILTQTQKSICQQLLSYSLFSVITISKRLEENKFAKEIKTLSEEVAAANFAPLVCFPA